MTLKLALCAVLLAAIFFIVEGRHQPMAVAADVMAATPSIVCGANARAVTSRAHLQCYTNCQNKDDLTRPCPLSLHHENFCVCQEGFIYKSGTSGDCVRPTEC